LIAVLKAGLLATVQDAGRPGHRASGMPVSGPMDRLAHAAANLLVGNEPGAAAVELTLVGGSCHGARKDWLVYVAAAGHALRDRHAPVFERTAPGSGLALGSLGAFLVLEAAEHARSRGVAALARLSGVMSECSPRARGEQQATLERMWGALEPGLRPGEFAIISGATGAEPATSEERAFLAAHPGTPVRAPGTYVGHGVEAQFAFNIAIGVLSLTHGRLYRATGSFETGRALEGPLTQVIVTAVGRAQGEGMVLLERSS